MDVMEACWLGVGGCAALKRKLSMFETYARLQIMLALANEDHGRHYTKMRLISLDRI